MLSIWEKHTLRNSKNSESFMNSIKGRMLVLFIFVFLIGCGLIGRIFYLQIVHGEEALNDLSRYKDIVLNKFHFKDTERKNNLCFQRKDL